MSVDHEEESGSEAVDGEPREVPKLVRMTKRALEASLSHHTELSVDDAAKAPTDSELERTAESYLHHHATREQLAKAREQLERQINTETVGGGKSKLPMIVGFLLVAAAGVAYLFPSSTTAPSDAAGEVTADTAAIDENTAERLQQPIDNRVGSAAISRQQKEELLEAQEEEQARLAAELDVRRKAEEARLAAELQVKRKAEQARLSAELEAAKRAERQRMQAELKAAKGKKKARLDAELKAAKRAEQQRIQTELAATKKADEARVVAELEAEINAEQARLAAEAAKSQAVVAETAELAEQGDAKFSANPCDGPTAKFLSTCR